MQPAIVAPETCRPDHRPDAVCVQGRGRSGDASNASPAGQASAERRRRRPNASMRASRRSSACLRGANRLRQIVVQVQHAVPDADSAADHADTSVAQRPKIDVRPLRSADQLHRRQPPGTQVRDPWSHRRVEQRLSDSSQPPHDVAAAIETRQPRVTADRDGDLSPRPLDFLGKLHAGSRRRRRPARRPPAIRRDCGKRVGVNWWIDAGICCAISGTSGTSQWPVAITTHDACHTPRSLSTR